MLPTSRNRTYSEGDAIDPDDLNDFQDQVIALHGGARGAQPRRAAPIGQLTSCSFSGGYLVATAAPAEAYIPLEVADGERITAIGMDRYGTGSGSIELSLRRFDAGVDTELEDIVVNNPAAEWVASDQALSAPHTVAGGHYYLKVSFTTVGQRVSDLRYTTDVP